MRWVANAAQAFGSALGNAAVEDRVAQDRQTASSSRPASQALAAEDTSAVKPSPTATPDTFTGNIADDFHYKDSPAAAEPQRYTIQKGDTYTKIARRLGISAAELALANPDINQFRLQIGKELTIPTAGSYSDADIAYAGKMLDKQNAQRLAAVERKQAQAVAAQQATQTLVSHANYWNSM